MITMRGSYRTINAVLVESKMTFQWQLSDLSIHAIITYSLKFVYVWQQCIWAFGPLCVFGARIQIGEIGNGDGYYCMS